MSTKFEEVKDSLEKVLLVLNDVSNEKTRAMVLGPQAFSIAKRPNIMQLSTASDKYVFLYNSEKFNLSSGEALKIWKYFKKNPSDYVKDKQQGFADYEPYEFFSEIKNSFPKLLSEERQESIELINQKRASLNLEPINF